MPIKIKKIEGFDDSAGIEMDPAYYTDLMARPKRLRRGCYQRRYRGQWYLKSKNAKANPDYVYRPFIEAAMGEFYRLILNDKAPKTRPVEHTDKKTNQSTYWLASKRILSKAIPATKSDGSKTPLRYDSKGNITRYYSGEIICTESDARSLALILISSYVFAENDLNYHNMRRMPGPGEGVHSSTFTGEYCRIDFDQSLRPITYRDHYLPITMTGGEPDFPITKSDLVNFPLTKDSNTKPLNIPHIEFDSIETKNTFDKYKWMYLLKFLLVDHGMYKRSSKQFINDGSDVRMLGYLENRIKELKTCLLTISKFRDCVINNAAEFKRNLMNEFIAFNAAKKPSDPVRFDLKKIEALWNTTLSEIYISTVQNDSVMRTKFITHVNAFLTTQINRLRDEDARHQKLKDLIKLRATALAIEKKASDPGMIKDTCQLLSDISEIAARRRHGLNCFTTPKSQLAWNKFLQDYAWWIHAFKASHNGTVIPAYATPIRIASETAPLLDVTQHHTRRYSTHQAGAAAK